MLVALLLGRSTWGLDWWSAGRMQAGLVMEGQFWRCSSVDASSDPGHIGSNLVLDVFGLMAGRILGGGVAWLVIVFSGALGNMVNALLQSLIMLRLALPFWLLSLGGTDFTCSPAAFWPS